jgi:D-3-phosphoglycerate dehydrogenase
LHRILISSKSFGYGANKEKLHELIRGHGLEPSFLPLSAATHCLENFEGLIIGTEQLTRDLFAKAERLRAVVKYGVGLDNIDAVAAREFGVHVLNLPGINSATVAEMALGLMLDAARRISEGDRLIRRGAWKGLIGTGVIGKTLGVIGTGSIGCSLARLVAGLQMTVLGYDLHPNEEFLAAGGRYAQLDELLRAADFVSIHLPLTERTRHFMDGSKLAQLKKSAFLINTSRGQVVDEVALRDALAGARIAGAALDVFDHEPAPLEGLALMDNVVLTPHIGAYVEETLRRMDEACLSALSNALQLKETARMGG